MSYKSWNVDKAFLSKAASGSCSVKKDFLVPDRGVASMCSLTI